MATIQKNGSTVTVPDEAVDEYLGRGWTRLGGVASPKPKRVRKSRARKPSVPPSQVSSENE